jgi:hypothetical protein
VPEVFISYRRQDSSGHTGRLHDRLAAEFGDERIILDVDDIELGLDFAKQISDFVAGCDALLAVIGPSWLTLAEKDGTPRIENPDDFVRLEIAAALERDVRVVPVLVNGAQMPTADQLPEEIKPLALRHGLELSDQRWSYDVGRLVDSLRPLDGPVEPRAEKPAPAPAPARGRRVYIAAIAAVAVVLAVVTVVLVTGGGADQETATNATLNTTGTFEPSELSLAPGTIFTVFNESGAIATLVPLGIDCKPVACENSQLNLPVRELNDGEEVSFQVPQGAVAGDTEPHRVDAFGATASDQLAEGAAPDGTLSVTVP